MNVFKTGASIYLLQLLHHLLDAELGTVRHLVLHLRKPLTQLLVLLIEDDPRIQPVSDLLFTQRDLHTHTHAQIFLLVPSLGLDNTKV